MALAKFFIFFIFNFLDHKKNKSQEIFGPQWPDASDFNGSNHSSTGLRLIIPVN